MYKEESILRCDHFYFFRKNENINLLYSVFDRCLKIFSQF